MRRPRTHSIILDSLRILNRSSFATVHYTINPSSNTTLSFLSTTLGKHAADAYWTNMSLGSDCMNREYDIAPRIISSTRPSTNHATMLIHPFNCHTTRPLENLPFDNKNIGCNIFSNLCTIIILVGQ